MIIQSSNLSFNANRNYAQSITRRASVSHSTSIFVVPNGKKELSEVLKGEEKDALLTPVDEKDKQQEDLSMNDSLFGLRSSKSSLITSKDYRDAMENIRRRCIEFLMKIFYGRKYDEGNPPAEQGEVTEASLVNQENANGVLMQRVSTESVVEVSYYEEETTSFGASGTVVNADGTTLSINVGVTMSRSLSTYMKEHNLLEQYTFVDPLVINLNTNIASLSDQKFEFDIDNDGILDTISSLNEGSGYLALDKNADGVINDGTELFGTDSGDGFKDLAAYDADSNGWIDEADPIFEKLLIWTKDECGQDKLYHLTEKGVGAICLSNASTDFSLKSVKDNATNGAIRSTGIFLYENGTAGTLQHLDIAK